MTLALSLPDYMNLRWMWLTVAAFVAGVMNAVAGGGSLLLFPAMLGMKMLPIQANATNTVALWPGQLTSIAAYRHDIRKNIRVAWPMGLAGLMGGSAGALLLLRTPQLTFLHLVPWLMILAAVIFGVSGPVTRRLDRRLMAGRRRSFGEVHSPHRLLVFLATILLCFYVGYFGAGAGFLIITMLSVFGFQDIHEINALKVVSTTMANGIAFVLFVVNGQVVWRYCLLAMVTCAVGGYTSASQARRVPQRVLRAFVVFIGLFTAAWFFYKNP